MRKQFECQRGTNLVRDVGHANVEERQLDVHEIPGNQHEFVSVLWVLESLAQLCHHPCVDFNGDDFLCPLQQQLGQVPCSRTYFQHHISRPNAWLVDHLVQNVRVYQDMLSVWLVENHTGTVDCLLLLYHYSKLKVDIIKYKMYNFIIYFIKWYKFGSNFISFCLYTGLKSRLLMVKTRKIIGK